MKKVLLLALTLCAPMAFAEETTESPKLEGTAVSRGKALSQTCAACHGANGIAISSSYPNLAGQYTDYLVKALGDYKSGARSNAIMSGFAASLTEQQMHDLAAYFSAQDGRFKTLPQ